ncbi:hypothetical protein KGY79_07975 [Candidatus Bipolaricaulota bacterium]|nr:hypothetical protein [Candidatus Bipolaricaulota bacterium]
MKESDSIRRDPLYRIIEETKELRKIESKFYRLFQRLKQINNLGLIPSILEMGVYPKYEHSLGTFYQINNLLEIIDDPKVENKYQLPLKIASLFLHTGHLPFTYSTEKALLLASNLGDRTKENEIKNYVKTKVYNILDELEAWDKDRKDKIWQKILSKEDAKDFYKYLSANIVVNNWVRIKEEIEGLKEEHLQIILKDMVDKSSDGYQFLQLADKADYVQRDALYFGTVQLDVSPSHLYRETGANNPEFSVDEEKLIENNLDYLKERFYEDSHVRWFSEIFEKILAGLIISKNFDLNWFEDYEYGDAEFKRLAIDGLNKDNEDIQLPDSWTTRAQELFNKDIQFKKVFDLEQLSFPADKDVIDLEYDLTDKRESKKGLLTYPFLRGVLLDIDYAEPRGFLQKSNVKPFDVRVFFKKGSSKLEELIRIIENISPRLSIINHTKHLREKLAAEISWTKDARIENGTTIKAITEAIKAIDEERNKNEQQFMEKFLSRISKRTSFDTLWDDFDNQVLWKSTISDFPGSTYPDQLYKTFTRGLLALPTKLLQYDTVKPYLNHIYEKMVEKMDTGVNTVEKGEMFEGLSIIDRIRRDNENFQFFINGMIFVDPEKEKGEKDDNEFDILEFILQENDKLKIQAYSCSIADNYEKKDTEQMTNLADTIRHNYTNISFKSKYIVPEDRENNRWEPILEPAGRDFET